MHGIGIVAAIFHGIFMNLGIWFIFLNVGVLALILGIILLVLGAKDEKTIRRNYFYFI